MIFVFGSNTAGIHGAGAAKVAAFVHGARRGKGDGHYGNSYAIATRNSKFVTLSLPKIQENVGRFIQYAAQHPNLEFKVTAIGTGHAGLMHEQMAPMFRDAPNNCLFDKVWEPWLRDKKFWGTFHDLGWLPDEVD
jgi:hypothetical protein